MIEFLKLFKRPTSSGIHIGTRRLDLFFNNRHQERKRRETKVFYLAHMINLVMVVLRLFIDFGNVNFRQKPLYFCLYLPMPINLTCVTL